LFGLRTFLVKATIIAGDVKMSESDCKMGWGHTGPCVTANCTCANNNANKLGVSNELQSLRDELAKLKEENERLVSKNLDLDRCKKDLLDSHKFIRGECLALKEENERLKNLPYVGDAGFLGRACARASNERDQALSELASLKQIAQTLYEEANPHGLELDYVSVRIQDYNRLQEKLDELDARKENK
jgi:uncharacterized coiled-coil DUF342 family protein